MLRANVLSLGGFIIFDLFSTNFPILIFTSSNELVSVLAKIVTVFIIIDYRLRRDFLVFQISNNSQKRKNNVGFYIESAPRCYRATVGRLQG
jgi:hypothetical protein